MTKVQALLKQLKEIRDGIDIECYEASLDEAIAILAKYERRIDYDNNQYEASVEAQMKV